MIRNIFTDILQTKTFKEELEEDLQDVIEDKKTIYWLVRKYGKYNREKEIRYKLIGIKRRLSEIEINKNDLIDIILN